MAEGSKALQPAITLAGPGGDVHRRILATECAPVPANAASTGPPFVSVVMPTWNRAHLVDQAIASVLAQTFRGWELIIVDDGSTDATVAVVGRFTADSRVRYIPQVHAGVSAARNRALREARGEVVCYLDSDNIWYPNYLAAVARAFLAESALQSTYGVLIADNDDIYDGGILSRPFDRDALGKANFIDLNVFAHRRALVERFGGFDPAMTRVTDWDLVLRFTAETPAKPLPVLSTHYRTRHGSRISTTENLAHNMFLLRRKQDRRELTSLRVLLVLWHYPQLSETYVETEIRCLRRLGVHVEAWSEVAPATPYPTDIPVHRGSLRQAVAEARPDILHIHWLHAAEQYLARFKSDPLPVTVRGHGFEYSTEIVEKLAAHAAVRRIYLFPTQVPPRSAERVCAPIMSAFDSDLFRPGRDKDRRLVVRTSAGLPTKDLDFFLRLAKRLPGHRFVLAIVRCNLQEFFVDEILGLNEEMGRPADVHVNLPRDQIAELVGRAGIYLHTHQVDGPPFGMAISIAEAMATGCHVLARRCRGTGDYLGPTGALYGDEDEAARLIEETVDWSDRRWADVWTGAVDRAFSRFADDVVFRTMLEDWQRLVVREVVEESPAAHPAEGPPGDRGLGWLLSRVRRLAKAT